VPLLPFEVPPGLERQRGLGPTWVAWLDRLPRLVRDVADEWQLGFDGAPLHGFCSLVVPVREPEGRPAVLKVAFDGDEEGAHEALGLQRWDGNGTVRMFRADPRRRALLLERLDSGRDLDAVPVLEACELVAGFYRRLHVAPPPQLQRLSSYIDRWTDGLAALPVDAPVPRRLVEQAVALGRSFVADHGTDTVMMHGDLHYQNVLAAEREPWLVIDPKPYVGDPAYDPLQHLLNCAERLHADPAGLAGRMAELCELDPVRLRRWLFARCVQESLDWPPLADVARRIPLD
jgi:streptomycin 6-kinase